MRPGSPELRLQVCIVPTLMQGVWTFQKFVVTESVSPGYEDGPPYAFKPFEVTAEDWGILNKRKRKAKR